MNRSKSHPAPPNHSPPGAKSCHVLERGSPSGRPVVLVHGLASLAEEILFPLAGPVTDRGYRIIAVDRPGYGGSAPVPAREMSPSAQARRLHHTLARLGVRDAILVAHSIGAAPALHLACRGGSGIAGLVLINPFCRPTRPRAAVGLRAATAPLVGPVIRKGLPAIAPTLGRRMVRAAVHRNQALPDLRAFPWRRMAQPTAVSAMADELNRFNADMIAFRLRLKRLEQPTVVLADPADPVIDGRAHAGWLSHRLPRSVVHWQRAGHLLHHTRPEAVVAAVQAIHAAVPPGQEFSRTGLPEGDRRTDGGSG